MWQGQGQIDHEQSHNHYKKVHRKNKTGVAFFVLVAAVIGIYYKLY